MPELRLAPAVSAWQLLHLKFSPFGPPNELTCCAFALIPSAITSSPTISSRPSNPLSALLLHLKSSFGLPLCISLTLVYFRFLLIVCMFFYLVLYLGPFSGAIAVPSIMRCRCCGHRFYIAIHQMSLLSHAACAIAGCGSSW